MNRNSETNIKDKIRALWQKFLRSLGWGQDDPQYYLTKGNQLQEKGNLAAARVNYEKALVQQPEWEQPYLALGNLMLQMGQVPESLEYYARAIAFKPDWAAVYFYRGNAYQCQGKYAQAMADYQQARELKLDWPELYQNLECALTALLNSCQSEGYLDRVLAKLQPFPPLASQKAAVYYQIASSLERLARLEEAVEHYQKAIALNPNWESSLAVANILATQGKLAQAEDFYRQVLALKPDTVGTYRQLASLQASQNKLPEAIATYQKLLSLQPDWEVYLAVGNMLLTLDQPDEAVASYQQALTLNPHSGEIYRRLGNLYASQGKLEEAIVAYQKSATLQPESDIYLALGNMLATQDKGEAAIANYQQALTLNPHSAEIYRRLGHACDKQNRPDEAVFYYQKSLQIQPDWKTYLGAGNILANHDKLEEAISSYRQAIALNSEAVEAYWRLGNALVSQDKADEAIAFYNQALALEADWKIHLVVGNTWLKQKQPDKAIASYQQALALNPQEAEIYWHLGNACDRQGQPEEAIANYQKASTLQPDWFAPHFAIGCVLTRQKKLEPALQSYQQALTLQPDDAEISHRIATVLERLDRLEEARENCQRAIALEPNSAELYMTLGSILVRQQQNEEALLYYEKAIELQPDWLDTYTQAGVSLFLDGKYDRAAQMWHRGLQKQRELAKAYQLDKLGIRLLGTSWLMAFGHIAFIDAHVKMSLLGWFPPHRTVMVITPKTKVPNQCLLDYWKPYIDFIDDSDRLPISAELLPYITDEFWAATLPDGQTRVHYRVAAEVQQQWEAENRPHLLQLSDTDRQRGWDCLEKLGVPRNAWFVSIHVREPGFHQKWNEIYGEVRDASIETYLSAIEAIVEFGGWVVRMGDPTMQPLPKMKQVVDYAHSDLKSKWMDIFLCGACRFFIGTNSGLGLVPPNFGVPCVHTNWGPMGVLPYFGADIYTPKLYWSEAENRYLSFGETIAPPIGHSRFLKYYREAGVQVIDNSAGEIEQVTREMLERLTGKLHYTEEEERLQEQYQQIAIAAGAYRGSRIGRHFLAKYAHLL